MRKIKPINILIFLCIVTTIIVATNSLSKYEKVISANDSAQVAVPIIQMGTNNFDVKISPADAEKSYIFKIKNSDGEKKSEVAMEYTLQFKNLNNLPLEFELYTYDNDIAGAINLLNGNITEAIPINLNSQEQTYQLRIKWKQDERSYKYAKVADYVQIILNSAQID